MSKRAHHSALDDTLFHHRGKKINGAGVPLVLPINMRLHRTHRASLIELAPEMIDEARRWFGQRPLRVVTDGFYATFAGQGLPATIISRMQRNAELYDLPVRPKSKRRVYARQVLWYRMSHQPVLLAISHAPASLRLWLYSMVWLWYLLQAAHTRYFIVQPRNPLNFTASLADALVCLRRDLWRNKIECMFGASALHAKQFEFLLDALAPAAQAFMKSAQVHTTDKLRSIQQARAST